MVEVIKKLILLIILAINTLCLGNTILERKVIIPRGEFDSYYVHPLNIFLTEGGSPSILIDDLKNLFLYTQNGLRTIDREGKYFINGFTENDHAKLAFINSPERYKYSNIDIYDIQKGFNKPAESIEIDEEMQDRHPEKFVAIPQTPGKYYVFDNKEKFSPMQSLRHMLSGGHGSGCTKPYLAEVNNCRISKYKEIKYGGKRIEGFSVKEIINNSKVIHFLGFRNEYGVRYIPRNSPFILYYAGYDLKKKKVTQSHNVYEVNYDPGSYNFGPLSMACKNDEVFVVFSFHKYPFRGAPQNNIKQITSDIYYFQYSDKTASDTVQIAKGFLPSVKLDSAGNVYVFWIDYRGNLFYKTKENDKWSKDNFIFTGIDILPGIICTKYISTEFDKDNNLHVVFPSKGNLVYAKVKLDFTLDKQN